MGLQVIIAPRTIAAKARQQGYTWSMAHTPSIDETGFRRILARNVKLPLAAGVASAGIFLALLLYLLGALSSVEHTERVIGQAQELRRLAVEMESGMRGFLLTGEEGALATYLAAAPRFQTSADTLQDLVRADPAQLDRVRLMRAQQREWERRARQLIDLRRQHGDYLSLVKSGTARVPFEELRELFGSFLAQEERMRTQRSTTARLVTYWTAAAFLCISLLAAGLLAWFGRRELLHLSGIYRDALHEEAQHGVQLAHQAWLREGQSQLAAQGIGQMALPQLSDTLLAFLARYLDVAVAAFYVLRPDKSLQRLAAYGFSHEEVARGAVLMPGEGLAGQVASHGRTLHLAQLPPGYVKVSSALGEGEPQQLIVLAVHEDGVVNGVLELGFLRPVGARELDFLALVAGNIGSAIGATVARQRLAEVLAETQALNEELQVQQEELRTANEELEEQSRVLERSQAALEGQKLELEQSNVKLEQQAEALDQRNAALAAARTELEARALDLEKTSQYKSQFLANMSHELRTPLNSALILAKLLADNEKGNLDEEQVRFARTIYTAGNDLLALINDILDISKVEAGKLELVPEDVALAPLLENLSAIFTPLALDKGLDLVLDLAPGVPATLYTDRQRLEQVLKNLLSNAIKFTERGKVILRLAPGADGELRFAVIDTGIGVPEAQQGLIFDAFQQGDSATNRRYGGTGLGLAISRDLARLLGGDIALVSAPGQGSTFTLTLPLHAAPRAPAAAPSVPAPSGKAPATLQAFADDRHQPPPPERSVLIIEDDAAFALILYDLAHEMSYRALVSLTAEEGLQLALEHQPAAILLDLRLPDRSGLSVLQLLKDNPQTRHIPVHVISATEHGDAALHLGAIGFARKPTNRDELLQVFARLERQFTQKIKRILLVEDDARQRDSMVRLIEDEDIAITAVASGAEALQELRGTVFDCMIMDLKLPDMQGSALLQKMSQEELASFPPVIVYTGRSLAREEEAELSRYSRSIIIKGARSPERLLDEVTLFLHKVESQLSSERRSMLQAVRSRDRVFEGRRILLVDDDVRNIFALTSALEQKGAAVEIGRNGHEALERLEQVPDIDLVLMDIMMPGMDGLEATRRMRADQRFARLPVIAITAKAMKDDQEKCLAAGASDYLAKPIDLSRLYSLLRVWMPAMDTL